MNRDDIIRPHEYASPKPEFNDGSPPIISLAITARFIAFLGSLAVVLAIAQLAAIVLPSLANSQAGSIVISAVALLVAGLVGTYLGQSFAGITLDVGLRPHTPFSHIQSLDATQTAILPSVVDSSNIEPARW